MSNSYFDQIERNLPRLLAMYDADETSETYGVGDRYNWAWKLIDFPNGTFQAAASGLAGLVASNLLPTLYTESAILTRIDAIVMAIPKVMSRNGSLAEALPNEGSFCVTGLVVADILLAMKRLDQRLSDAQRQRWFSAIEPLVTFLKRQDEFHGLISNHLATNALALIRWTDTSSENLDARAKVWIDRILKHQSSEGWFKEYDGADAGYQTWCTSSLAAVHKLRPNWNLAQHIENSLQFISYAAHPDGSFGGTYGSRMTRFIFPAGFEMLAKEFPMANALASFTRQSVTSHCCVTLDSIDPPNLVPLFNDYVTAALSSRQNTRDSNLKLLPCNTENFRQVFAKSGWLVDKGDKHYTVLNLRKGGTGIHVIDRSMRREISAYIGRNGRGQLLSTQRVDSSASWVIDKNTCNLRSSLRRVIRPRPGPFQFAILRLLSITLFRSLLLGNLVKRILAYLLISHKPSTIGKVDRTIKFGYDFDVSDKAPNNLTPVTLKGFKSIHMASMGYWQAGD